MTRTSGITLLCLIWKLYYASGFNLKSQTTAPFPSLIKSNPKSFLTPETPLCDNTFEFDNLGTTSPRKRILSIGVPSISFLLSTTAAFAADEIEVQELPPVYIPILFALACLGGVGLLTSTLGDVIADEASLGNLSGAKAKKEMERSRSSYFKK